MKRIFTLFCIMALALNASAEYFYDCYIDGPVEFQDLSYEYLGDSIYKYQFQFAQKSYNRSDKKTYSATATIVLMPLTRGYVGTFTYDDYSLFTGTEVYASSNHRTAKSGATITIADNHDGTYTLSGNLKVGSSNTWNYNFNDPENDPNNPKNTFTISEPDPFEQEPTTKQTFDVVGNSIQTANYITDKGYLEVDIYDGKFAFGLYLAFPTDTMNLPAGTYAVANTKAKGTILASEGFDGYYAIMSYLDYLTDNSSYCITEGSIQISYSADNKDMTLAGTLTTGHGSTIHVTATDKNPFYVEPSPTGWVNTVIEGNATKMLINGVLIIENNGARYNAQGIEL